MDSRVQIKSVDYLLVLAIYLLLLPKVQTFQVHSIARHLQTSMIVLRDRLSRGIQMKLFLLMLVKHNSNLGMKQIFGFDRAKYTYISEKPRSEK